MNKSATHELLLSCGYKLVEDAWAQHGRLTYVHDDNLTRSYMVSLSASLKTVGWELDKAKLRSFRHHPDLDVIEAEPGGSETSGHFLHYMHSSVEAEGWAGCELPLARE